MKKNALVSLYNKNNIEYTEKNLSSNPESADELRSLGYKVTPVTFVGETVIVGFNTTKLAEALL